MDRQEASQALAHADSLGRRMRQRARWMAGGIAALGVSTIAMVLVIGLYDDVTAIRIPAFLAVLAALLGMNLYVSSRPVVLRRHLTAHFALTGLGVAFFTVTITVGAAVFPESLLWWIGGALLSGLPFFLAVLLNLVGARRA